MKENFKELVASELRGLRNDGYKTFERATRK